MKAVAKHDCTVTLYFNLNAFSFNTARVVKGQEIELSVYEDKQLAGRVSEVLGNRSVIFKDDYGCFIPTYSRDFEYVE